MAVFAGGSALAGAAQGPAWLIGARAVSILLEESASLLTDIGQLQGVGSGGIDMLGLYIVTDLVGLSERGMYSAILQVAGAMGALFGTLVGSIIANRLSWSW
jgi:MFS family permease